MLKLQAQLSWSHSRATSHDFREVDLLLDVFAGLLAVQMAKSLRLHGYCRNHDLLFGSRDFLACGDDTQAWSEFCINGSYACRIQSSTPIRTYVCRRIRNRSIPLNSPYHSCGATSTADAAEDRGHPNILDGNRVWHCHLRSTDCVSLMTYRACISSALSVYYRNLLNESADITWNLLSVNVLRYLRYPYTGWVKQRLILESVAEMSIGLCCVSMPAVSKMLVHHLPPYEKLKSWFDSKYDVAKSTIHSSSRKAPRLGRDFYFDKTDTSRSRDSYIDIEGNKPGRLDPYGRGSVKKPVRTFISSGENHGIDEQGIHCEIELQQQSHQREGL